MILEFRIIWLKYKLAAAEYKINCLIAADHGLEEADNLKKVLLFSRDITKLQTKIKDLQHRLKNGNKRR